MSWKTAATLLTIVFVLVMIQSVLAQPLSTVTTDLNATGDYNNEHFDGNARITGYFGDWLNMGLIGIFGILMWGFARVLRRELTRGRGGGGL